MTKAEIKEFKRFVRETLVEKYKMDEIAAAHAVRDSYLSKALEMDNGFVEHDTIEEWADIIYEGMNSEELLRM